MLGKLRYAASTREAMLACADLIESRPAALLTTDVHELLEACVGIGAAGADVLQNAARMFRAYTLGELPHGKGCALVALLRLPSSDSRVMSTTTAIDGERRRRRESTRA